MSDLTIIAIVSIIMGGITMAIGSIGPAIGEAWSLTRALNAIAQQPDASRYDHPNSVRRFGDDRIAGHILPGHSDRHHFYQSFLGIFHHSHGEIIYVH